jgi:hypothetical protein
MDGNRAGPEGRASARPRVGHLRNPFGETNITFEVRETRRGLEWAVTWWPLAQMWRGRANSIPAAYAAVQRQIARLGHTAAETNSEHVRQACMAALSRLAAELGGPTGRDQPPGARPERLPTPRRGARPVRRTLLERSTPLRRAALRRHPRGRMTAAERAAWQAFVDTAAAQPRCAACGSEGPWDPHHAGVDEQDLQRMKLPLWDPANALRVCWPCYAAHHAPTRRIPLSALRDENIRYAFACLGARAYDYLRRRYAGEDPRADVALRNLTGARPPADS